MQSRRAPIPEFCGHSDSFTITDGEKFKEDANSDSDISNLLPDCFLFQLLQLSSQLFGLIPKLVEALRQ